jgi:alpha-methylacyl-CoA racemase
MLFSDLGATVVRIERAQASAQTTPQPLLARGREWVYLDLKRPEDVAQAMAQVVRADVLIEGFRPGVMERLGLGPAECLASNERLIYGRCTGWGQTGPLAQRAGHDINYIALTGALAAIGTPASGPLPPLNLVGDFGGGAMLLAVGVLAALFERTRSARGQIVDAAMVDGASLLMTMIHELKRDGQWQPAQGANLLDGGAPFYRCYRCADGKWLAVGAIEMAFRIILADIVGVPALKQADADDPARWADIGAQMAAAIALKSRDEWMELLEPVDACCSPVLSIDEAPFHPHNRSRNGFALVDGHWMPAAAPRFSRVQETVGRNSIGLQ